MDVTAVKMHPFYLEDSTLFATASVIFDNTFGIRDMWYLIVNEDDIIALPNDHHPGILWKKDMNFSSRFRKLLREEATKTYKAAKQNLNRNHHRLVINTDRDESIHL